MSGTDVKRQVVEALAYEGRLAHTAKVSLAPCTVLTPEEREKRDEMVNRVFYLAEHLHQMIPREVWRESGAELEGHYERDYRAEKVQDELASLYAALLSPEAGDE